MRLKVLAISDTHLGEETSLLSFPQGLQHVWSTLVHEFWGNLFPEFDPDPKKDPRKQVEIEELILLGDIADRTLSSTSQIYNHYHAFSQMLGSVAKIAKGVYVPGNHDHTMWTDYVSARSGGVDLHGVIAPSGDPIVEQGERCDEKGSAEDNLHNLIVCPNAVLPIATRHAAVLGTLGSRFLLRSLPDPRTYTAPRIVAHRFLFRI
jgi:predicted MPP superfamily phosphohydrolase